MPSAPVSNRQIPNANIVERSVLRSLVLQIILGKELRSRLPIEVRVAPLSKGRPIFSRMVMIAFFRPT
jgi:hypothetical protein